MMTVDEALIWADMTPLSSAWAVLAAEVRRLREERSRLLDEAAERAVAWAYRNGHIVKELDTDDQEACDLCAAGRGEVEK